MRALMYRGPAVGGSASVPVPAKERLEWRHAPASKWCMLSPAIGLLIWMCPGFHAVSAETPRTMSVEEVVAEGRALAGKRIAIRCPAFDHADDLVMDCHSGRYRLIVHMPSLDPASRRHALEHCSEKASPCRGVITGTIQLFGAIVAVADSTIQFSD